jgi:NAD-dependent deacetylase
MNVSPIETAAHWLAEARSAVAITGAGVSTPSGIPDFRSAGSGLWEKADALSVVSLTHFRRDPLPFYQWVVPLARSILAAEPNPAHHILAQWEKQGILRTLITQNIDLLHEKAGSQHFWEVHGHLRTLTCTHCMEKFPALPILASIPPDIRPPKCTNCGWVLKPDVILFGEQLPYKAIQGSLAAVKACDVLLVAGSSLEVYPVAEWPSIAQQRGAKLILVNRTPTYLDGHANLVLHGNVEEILPAIDAVIRARSFTPQT